MEPFLSSRFSSSSTALEEDVQEEDVLQDVLRVQVATFNLRAHRSVRVSSLNPHQAWLKDLRMPLKLLNLLGGRGGGCSGSFQPDIPGCPPFPGDNNGGQQHQRDTGHVHLSVSWRKVAGISGVSGVNHSSAGICRCQIRLFQSPWIIRLRWI